MLSFLLLYINLSFITNPPAADVTASPTIKKYADFISPADTNNVEVAMSFSSYGEGCASACLKKDFTDNLFSALVFDYSQDFFTLDRNNDCFYDLPKFRTYRLANVWEYQRKRYQLHIDADFTDRHVVGGQIPFRGYFSSNSIYGISNRYSDYNFHINNRIRICSSHFLDLNAAFSYYNHNSIYGIDTYSVKRHDYTLTASYAHSFTPRHTITAGFSHTGNFITETLNMPGSQIYSYPIEMDLNHLSLSLFLRYNLRIDSIFDLTAGMRSDYNSALGIYYSPKLSASYRPFKHTVFSVTAKRKSIIVSPTEQYHYFFATSRRLVFCYPYNRNVFWHFIVNASQDFNVAGHPLSFSAEYQRYQYEHKMVLDRDLSESNIYIYFSDQQAYVSFIRISGSFGILRGLTLDASWFWNKAYMVTGNKLQSAPLTSKYNGDVSISYATPRHGWKFSVNGRFIGGGRLYANPTGKTHFNAFQLLNARIDKTFRHWNVFVGVDNITGYHQKTPIIGASDPFGPNFDATLIYAPTLAQKYYVGVKFNY